MSLLKPQLEGQIPQVIGIIQRPRLLRTLQAVRHHKLTLISAPPGYGKTTVAAQFARQCDCPIVWHALEERERDVPNLYMKCLAVLEPVVPSIAHLAVATSYAPSEFAALVADHLRMAPATEIVYILDDVHHLVGSPAAETWLRVLVELVPSNCHLVLISRILPNVPLVQMIARSEVLAIGQDDLRLDESEIQALAMAILGTSLPDHTLDELVSRLEGWPAGTVIALRPLPHVLEQTLLQSGQGPEALFDALASSMLRAQPPGLRNFLLAASTLKRLTPELCTEVLGVPDGLARFDEMQSRNLFAVRTPGGLVLHSLFRNFLQRELKATRPALFVELHNRAAVWFEENDILDDAYEHYLAAGLMDDAARVADYVTLSYFGQGKVETLLEWGAMLPGEQAPRLLYTCAMIHTDRYEYTLAEAELAQAEKGFAARNDRAGLCGLQFQRAFIRLQQGDYPAAIAQASALLSELPPELTNLRGRALRTQALAYLNLGELETAIALLEEALPIYRGEGDALALSLLLQDFAVAYSQVGRVDEARACLQEVVALTRSLGSPGALAMALNNLGYYFHRSSDYHQALATFQEALSIAARVRDKRAESYLLCSIGDLQRDRGDFGEALQLYYKALELLGNSEPFLRCVILISVSVLQRWHGHYQDAIAFAEEAITLADQYNLGLARAGARATRWAAWAYLANPEPALNALSMIAAELAERNARLELVTVLGQCASVAQQCQDPIAVRHYLQMASQTALEIGCTQPLAAEINYTPALEAAVMAEAPRYEALVCDLKRLHETRHQPTPEPAPRKRTTTYTYSLRVRTFGREVIERNGEPVSSSEWRGTNAKELFLYLLFWGATTKERLNLIFWPDKSSRQLRANFHTTLHRARQALGENVIVFNDGFYAVSPNIELWCDAQKLEQLTQRARLLPPRDARTEDLWRKAALLYQGDFLPSVDAEWAMGRREFYRNTYIEALIGMGECARVRHDLRAAIENFKLAVTADPYREEVHRAIMMCYAGLGERQLVLAHLRDLQKLLRNDLDLEPSAETLALAEALLR